jgi:hypothetical protein
VIDDKVTEDCEDQFDREVLEYVYALDGDTSQTGHTSLELALVMCPQHRWDDVIDVHREAADDYLTSDDVAAARQNVANAID